MHYNQEELEIVEIWFSFYLDFFEIVLNGASSNTDFFFAKILLKRFLIFSLKSEVTYVLSFHYLKNGVIHSNFLNIYESVYLYIHMYVFRMNMCCVS